MILLKILKPLMIEFRGSMPKFRSPSGQVLGMPDIDGRKNSSFSKDTQSENKLIN